MVMCTTSAATQAPMSDFHGHVDGGPPQVLAPHLSVEAHATAPDVVAWVAKPDAPPVVRYPSPAKTGFHGARSAGHAKEAGDGGGDQLALSAVTVNSTSWGPLKDFLAHTDAHLVFGQEHRLPAHDIPAASAWARRHGWKSVWAPATRGPRGGWSAGTVILARSFIGLRHPDVGGRVVTDARTVAAVVEAPSFRPFLAYCAYGWHGQGLSKANLGLCAAIGEHWESQGDPALQFLAAADWNLEPHDLERAGLAGAMEARIVCPATARGTCRSRTKAAMYDYFVMSRPMSNVINQVRTLEATGIRTHAPVELEFLPRPTSLRALTFRRPPEIPIERVVGPVPPPPTWDPVLSAADGLCEAIRGGAQEDAAERALTDLYSLWLDVVEQELLDVTGTSIGKEGLRGGGPRLIWRSLLPEKRGTGSGASASAAWAWMDDLLRDLSRVSARRDAREDRLALAAQLRVAAQADRPRGCDRFLPEATVVKVNELVSEAICLVMKDDDDLPMTHGDDGALTDDPMGFDDVDDNWKEWHGKLQSLVSEARAELRASTATERTERSEKWREWVREGFERGARNAHAYSRLPAEWQPSTVLKPDGTVSAEPTAILEGQRRKFAEMWSAGDEPGGYCWTQRQALPRLTPEELRASSRLFKVRTAVAQDGLHMRHYALMSDGALTALAAILEACELLGTMPRQCRLVTAPLLEKPKGGFRPICIYASLYRIWAKARQPVAAEWEERHQRAYLSAAAGNGPADTVWRQAVRQEVAVGQGGHAASLLWDLEGFFERVDRARLMDRAAATGFPLPVLRLSLSMYAAPRVLTLDGRIARELWARDGVGAGCGLACTYVKVYSVPPIDQLLPKLPPTVSLDVHVDDFVLSCEASTVQEVVRDLQQAQADLKAMIDEELGAKVSMPKAAMVASSLALAKALRQAIGEMAGPLRDAAPNLGFDAAAAKKRGTRNVGPLRNKRLASGWKRRGRLRQLASVVGSKARKIYTAGVGPSATYYASVQGLSDREALAVRRLAACVLPPRSRYRSLTIAHIINDMPTAITEVAATLQFSRMVWAATVCGAERPRFEGFGLPGLREAWAKVKEGVDNIIDADAKEDARRRYWKNSRGPLSAVMLELDRVGWSASAPFEWRDDQGVRVALTETPPALLRDMLVASVRRKAERTVGAARARHDPAFEGRRACCDVAMDSLARSRTLLPKEKGAFRSVITNAVLTMGRAAAEGYDVPDICPLCGECGDTIFHRVYRCAKTRDAVQSVVPKWFWREAQQASADDLFWTTGIMPHPADIYPPPRDDYLPWVIEADGERGEDPSLSGHVFIDGSCSVSCIRGMQRASLAMVQVDDDARRVKTVSLPLWCTLPQTSQASEHAVYAAVTQLLAGDAVVYGDCKTVVDAANAPLRRQLDGRRKYAGVLLAARRNVDSLRRMTALLKVKAHQDVAAIEDLDERWRARGNQLADEAAKEARERHPKPTPEQEATVAYYVRRTPHIVKAVGRAMAMFPPAGGNLPRKGRPAPKGGGGASARRQGHDWVHAEGRWRCTRCWTYVLGDEVPVGRRYQKCDGRRVTAAMRRAESLGHHMLHAEGALPIAYCSRCGGWSSRRAQLLARPCAPPTASGRAALRRIAKGQHPWRAKDKTTGSECPRSRLSAVARDGPSMGRDEGRDDGDDDMAEPRRVEVLDDGDEDRGRHGPLNLTTCGHSFVDEATDGQIDEPDVFGHGVSLDDEGQQSAGTALAGGGVAMVSGGPQSEDGGGASATIFLDEDGRDPRIRGTSLGMVATVVQQAEAARSKGRKSPYGEGRWAVFNQVTGLFTTTTVEAILAEQCFLIREFNASARAAANGPKRRKLETVDVSTDAIQASVRGGVQGDLGGGNGDSGSCRVRADTTRPRDDY